MTAQRSPEHFIARQIAYYRARAPEFDLADDDHRAEADEERIPDAELPAVLRTLDDGTPHVAIKLFHEPLALADALTELGWDAEVHSAGHRFPWGTASRR